MKKEERIIGIVEALNFNGQIRCSFTTESNVDKISDGYDANLLLAYCCSIKQHLRMTLPDGLYVIKIIPSKAKKVDHDKFPLRVNVTGEIKEVISSISGRRSWTSNPDVIDWWKERNITTNFRVEFTPITFEELNHGV